MNEPEKLTTLQQLQLARRRIKALQHTLWLIQNHSQDAKKLRELRSHIQVEILAVGLDDDVP